MIILNIKHKCDAASSQNLTHAGTELSNIVLASFIHSLIDPAAKNLFDVIAKYQKKGEALRFLAKSYKLLLDPDNTYFSKYIVDTMNNIDAQVKSMISILYGEDTMERSLGVFLIGPPGTGKTSLMKQLYSSVKQYASQFADQEILLNLDNFKRKDIMNMRNKQLKNKLIIGMMFSGSFFDKFGKDKLQVFDSFIETVKYKLENGNIVFIGIDEIDSLLYNSQSNLRAEFLVRLDELYNSIKKGNKKGLLFLVCTTNGGNFDEAMVRRISREIVVFNYPEPIQQIVIFTKKLSSWKEKITKKTDKLDNLSMDVLEAIIKKNIYSFSRFGVEFSGAELENITVNFYITLINLPQEHLLNYGDTYENQASNLLMFYMLKESWKILKIRQKKFAIEIKETLAKIMKAIKYPDSCPKIEAGTDWNN